MLNTQISSVLLNIATAENLTSVRMPGTIVGPISRFLGRFYNMLFDWLNNSVSAGALGLAIIIFTLVVKLILFPLMVNQQKSSAKMQMLQPEMNRIREKYKGKTDQMSQQRMAVELQDFQKGNGISMLGGCLPMLVQLPILYALFYLFQNAYMSVDVIGQNYVDIANAIINIPVGARMEAFSPFAQAFADAYAKSATIKESGFDMGTLKDVVMLVNYLKVDDWAQIVATLGTNANELLPLLEVKNAMETFLTIPLVSPAGLKWPGILVPLLAGGTTFIQTKITTSMTPTPDDANNPAASMTKTMLYIMPIMMGFFCITMPAGLGLYWIIGNIFGMIQQVILNKVFKKKFLKEAQENG